MYGDARFEICILLFCLYPITFVYSCLVCTPSPLYPADLLVPHHLCILLSCLYPITFVLAYPSLFIPRCAQSRCLHKAFLTLFFKNWRLHCPVLMYLLQPQTNGPLLFAWITRSINLAPVLGGIKLYPAHKMQ